ncbi:hypothetical protein CSA56_14865 [candidate division KSB3 bacterium]|uniref:Protein kinase domain-containing protein n=1 Tax=candidate division KSB3 bacterium TaxID=2044937 RepID=A0A2G6KAB4_9BACT|nr:MAG: hypothetical protein CSA56_14865 [candidate division KSB3 bacterium]
MAAHEDHTLTGGEPQRHTNKQSQRRDAPAPSEADVTLTPGKMQRQNPPQSPQESTLPGPKKTKTERTLTHTMVGGKGELVDKLNWEIGDVIDGRFEVVEVIGRGGMGIVYRVNHREWKLEMAVKMPLKYLVSDAASKARFIREAQTWVDLGLHPNIVQCWYVRELGGVPRVFMDYIDGGSLKDWIREGKVKPGEWDKILDLIIQACDGLGYAHEQGVEVHRDVKPGNMLLTQKGDLLVTDFGIVKRAGVEEIEGQSRADTSSSRQADHTITATGSELGTPEYGAPEQWGGAKHADRRADIYGLGVILFELCCGRRPFDDGSHSEPVHVIIGRHLSSPVPEPRIFNPDVPDPLATIILACLEKDPGKRPNTMLDLRNELTRVHREIIGKNYRRMIPQAADLRSDALNNRAVSFLDLDREQDAFVSWDEALKLDAYHPESLYNRSLLYWRGCSITDDDVIKRLEEAKHVTQRSSVYLGFIHLERASADEAEQEFMNALRDKELANNSVLWRALGDARLAQKHFAQAKEAYQRALVLMPRDSESLERLELARKRTREQDEEHILFRWQRCCRFFGSGHEGGVNSVAVAPDGRCLVSGGEDKIVRVWNPMTRECLFSLKGHEDHVLCVAITPDGTYAVSGSCDKTVRLWDLSIGRLIKTFRGHTDWVSVIDITPDGRRAVSGSRDKTLRQWEIPTGKCFWVSESFPNRINGLKITPDGRYALSGHDEENLYLWDLTTGKRTERKYYGTSLETLGFRSDVASSLAISTDGQFAVSGDQNANLRMWDLQSGQELQKLQGGHDENITAVAFTSDNRYIISGSDDATVGVWDIQTGEHIWTFDGHKSRITSLDTAQNGQFVVSSSQDGTLRFWNPRKKEKLWIFWGEQGHKEAVTTVAVALNGRFIVSGSQDMSLRLWDMTTAGCLRSYDGHVKDVTCVATTPEGRLAVSGSRDGTLLLWELGTSQCLRTFRGHRNDVTAVAITVDGEFVISGSDDNMIRVWNLRTGKTLRIFKGHDDRITSVAATPDGRFIVSGSRDMTVRMWNISTGKCVRTFTGHEESVTTLSVLSDGRFVVSGSEDHTLRLWYLATGKCIRVFYGHKEGVNSVVTTQNRRFVISGSDDKTIRLWELATAKCLRTFTGHTDQVTAVTLTLNDRYVVSASRDTTLRLWDLDSSDAQHYESTLQVCRQQNHEELQLSTERFRKRMAWAKTAWDHGKVTTAYRYLSQARSIAGYERAPESLKLNALIGETLPRKSLRGEWQLWTGEEHDGEINAVAITPDGQTAVSASSDMTLRSWDIATRRCVKLFDGHWLAVTTAAITPDGRFVVSGSEDTALRLWDISTGHCLRIYEGHEQDVTALALSLYGRFIVSGSKDGTVRIWNPSTTKCLRVFKGHHHGVTAVAMTPDRRYIVSGGEDRTLRLWDRSNGKCLRTFKGHKLQITAVMVTPDGRYILSASRDGTLRLWNIDTAKHLFILRKHEGAITSVALTPDGRFAFSGGDDKTLQLWDLAAGKNIWTMAGHKQGVTAIAISPDGRFVISGSQDRTIRLCELDWELDTSEITPFVGEESSSEKGFFQRVTSIFRTK